MVVVIHKVAVVVAVAPDADDPDLVGGDRDSFQHFTRVRVSKLRRQGRRSCRQVSGGNEFRFWRELRGRNIAQLARKFVDGEKAVHAAAESGRFPFLFLLQKLVEPIFLLTGALDFALKAKHL